jgi:hypothetical protein
MTGFFKSLTIIKNENFVMGATAVNPDIFTALKAI